MFACGSAAPMEGEVVPGGPVAERASANQMAMGFKKAFVGAGAGVNHAMKNGVTSMGGPQKVTMSSLVAPSRNDRNNKMVLEVAQFSRQVQLLHSDISTWSNGIDAGLSTMKAMLEAPLPIPYDFTPEGQVAAFDPEPHAVGHSVQTENFPKAIAVMRAKLAEECLNPLAKWLDAAETIRIRNLKCHQLGLDVDAQTAVVGKAVAKLTKAQEMAPEPGLTPEAVLEAALITHQTEEDKLVRLEQRFAEMEASVFNALLDVMRDAQVVREYAAAALVIMQGSVHTALSSFDLGATPDPYKLPEVCTPEIKLPNFAAVTIPMASMRKGGLYEFRDTLCTKAEDPLQAAVTDVRATAEFQPGIAAQAGIAPVQLAGSPGFESP